MIVYTYGVFDLFHYGHLRMLKQASKLGDFLIVGVFTDKVAAGFKRKPIINQRHRKLLIEELNLADKVVYQDDFSPLKNLRKYRAEVVAKGEGAGWSDTHIPEFPNCETVYLKYTAGISTSDIIKKCLSSQTT